MTLAGENKRNEPADEQEHENEQPEEQAPDETTPAEAEGSIEIKRHTGDDEEDIPEIPDELPVLPLRGLVVYPETAVPLLVGQPRSIRLVDDVVGGDRLVALVASHNPDNEEPAPQEIYTIGTAAAVHRLFRAPDGTIRLLVQGLARIRVTEYTATEPYLSAKVEQIPETVEERIEAEA